MAKLGNITKRLASRTIRGAASVPIGLARSAYQRTSKEVGQYVRQFGFVGDVLADAANQSIGFSSGRSGSTGGDRSGVGGSFFGGERRIGSSIISLLSSIDATLKNIYRIQQQENTEDLYDAERFKKKDHLGILQPQKQAGEDKGGLKGVLAFLGLGVAALMGVLKAMLPVALAKTLSTVVQSIGSAIVSGITKLLAAAGLKGALTPGGKVISTTAGKALKTVKAGVAGAATTGIIAGASYYMDKKDLDERRNTGQMSQDEYNAELSRLKGRSIGAGVGGTVGAVAGAALGPVGAYAGGVVGGIVGDRIGGGVAEFMRVSRPLSPTEGIGRAGAADPALGGINFEAFREAIAKRESQGRYDAENSIGFLGKYQFGAAALKDLGLIRADAKGSNKEILSNPANWTGGMSKEDFLSNPALQEELFRRFTIANYREGIRLGIIKKDDKPQLVASKLAARHLSGWGNSKVMGARHYFESGGKQVASDAFGTKVSEYAKLGADSQSSPTLLASSITKSGVLSPDHVASLPPTITKGAAIQKAAMTQSPVNVNMVNAPSVSTSTTGGGSGGGRASSGIPGSVENPVMDSSMLDITTQIYYP